MRELARIVKRAPSEIDIYDTFASYGLASVNAVELATAMEDWLQVRLSQTIMYDYPTIEKLSLYLAGLGSASHEAGFEGLPLPNSVHTSTQEPIAIIGMACRFPGGSTTPEAFWQLLRDGRDGIVEVPSSRWNIDAFYDPDPQAPGKMYTRSAAFLDSIDQFDARFFELSPREAARMDPQQRLLFEVGWEAFERAGLTLAKLADSRTGVFVGMMNNQEYMWLQEHQGLGDHDDDPYYRLGSASSVAAGRLSYYFNLKGPALTIDTACSSSLVAMHIACQSLHNGECTLALVGGVHIILQPENMVNACKMGMLAVDGYCKTFDAAADGFALGEGCGAVVLKPLSAALADNDSIIAVIRGSAVNQDGRSNGLTAPNKHAQEEVIRQALANAHVDPSQIQYVEAHGSATALGDPIEVEALMAVMGKTRPVGQPLLIGSVKTNLGHLAGAAGMAGFIKTVLALSQREIPQHIHLSKPNPYLDWNAYPVKIVDQRQSWPNTDGARMAGVSSFGWSGTNAHLILEEAPFEARAISAAPKDQLLLLSAKTETALEAMGQHLAHYLQAHPRLKVADVAYTTQSGRTTFRHRRAVVSSSLNEAMELLASKDGQIVSTQAPQSPRSVAYLFPGVGEQLRTVFPQLYREQEAFRTAVERCSTFLQETFELDLLHYLLGKDRPAPAANESMDLRALLGRKTQGATVQEKDPLQQTHLAQPALFVMEYGLVKLLESWGIRPSGMLGYSLGEYVAACIAGVFSLEAALTLVVRRARLIQVAPQGSMLAVALAPEAVKPYLNEHVNLAAINAPATCVLAGPIDAIERVRRQLEERGIVSRLVETTHAFHSAMLHPLRDSLIEIVRSIPLHTPAIPYISNVTGTWITPQQATNPAYWADHMCQTVQFAGGVAHLLQEKELCIVEVGPGQSLTSFARQSVAIGSEKLERVSALLPAPHERITLQRALVAVQGRLWTLGVALDWRHLHEGKKYHILPLPTYPFERQRAWFEYKPQQEQMNKVALTQRKHKDRADWFYVRDWEQAVWPKAPEQMERQTWLMFVDQYGFSEQLACRSETQGVTVVRVQAGEQFAQPDPTHFVIRPGQREDYDVLCRALKDARLLPDIVVHCWNLTDADGSVLYEDRFRAYQEHGFFSILFLIQALQTCGRTVSLSLKVLTNNLLSVNGTELLQPEKAPVLAACTVIQQEYPSIHCNHIDIDATLLSEEGCASLLIERMLAEICDRHAEGTSAHRDGLRYIQKYKPVQIQPPQGQPHLKEGGVYLITGGLGDIGFAVAQHLARSVQARLVLVGREMPVSEEEQDVLAPNMKRKVERLQQLVELGAEILPIAADVADEGQMGLVIEQALKRFGTINGVFHAAGILHPGTLHSIQKTDNQACEVHFGPKVYGALVLERVLKGIDVDFCLLFSSISTVLGGIGLLGYAAANSFLDVFAAQRYRQTGELKWMSVNWDTWDTASVQNAVKGNALQPYMMTIEEGLVTLDTILAHNESPVLVNSTGNLQERIQQWSKPTTPQRKPASKKELTSAANTQIVPAKSSYERTIAGIWKQALGLKEITLDDNFFDVGGNSLIGMQVIAQVNKALSCQLSTMALFEAPTVSALARHIVQNGGVAIEEEVETTQTSALEERRQRAHQSTGTQDIAIIGMAGRFPGADTLEQFWYNLRNGVESITFFSEEELAQAGVPEHLLKNPDYVRARPLINGIEQFDATFFGYSAREAELLDPQHRLFLESCWEALETAGYDTSTYPGLVGVFGGSSMSSYLLTRARDILGTIDDYQLVISNDKDSLTTTVSYKLNLKGPSFAVQTFCSTSLVATHLACQSLLRGECDMALAGGISIHIPSKAGHLHQDGGMESPDGHCRTFDAQAKGTIFGDGVGIVVLKRLDEAIKDGDTITAVIKGSAINNDGSLKVSYSAPSVVGQTESIKDALARANVQADTISYVEAHGTGTELGDPIEVTALTKAFRTHTALQQYCVLGSVKPNVGHLDRAAGISGLIKTALSLKNREIPPTLHFQEPNPVIDFANSPFYVSNCLMPWQAGEGLRRALVNSLGMGGTNAHVVLEEAPEEKRSDPARRSHHLLVLSAKTAEALGKASDNLRAYLQEHPDVNLADVAYTLHVGRRRFAHRRVIVCRQHSDAIEALKKNAPTTFEQSNERPTTFLVPTNDPHWLAIARNFYESIPEFREIFDRGSSLVMRQIGEDLAQHFMLEAALDARASKADNNDWRQARLQRLALFLSQYGFAHLLSTSGVQPQALLGIDLGEVAVAVLSGVLTFEQALSLLIEAAPMYGRELGGDEQAELKRSVERIAFQAPHVPYISSLLGAWMTAEMAIMPAYWMRVLNGEHAERQGVDVLLQEPDQVIVTLGSQQAREDVFARHVSTEKERALFLDAIAVEEQGGAASLLSTLGNLWLAGAVIDWNALYTREYRRRTPLPTYPFERQRYWIEVSEQSQVDVFDHGASKQKRPLDNWFYLPTWTQAPPIAKARLAQTAVQNTEQHWLFFMDEDRVAERVIERLGFEERQITRVVVGDGYRQIAEGLYAIHPARLEDYEALLKDLQQRGHVVNKIAHLWSITPAGQAALNDYEVQEVLDKGFYSLILLAQAMGNLGVKDRDISVISNGMHQVSGYETLIPEKATLLGPCRVIPQEYAALTCRSIDIALPEYGSRKEEDLLRVLCAEVAGPAKTSVIALRGAQRWIQTFEPMELMDEQEDLVARGADQVVQVDGVKQIASMPLRENGTYLITGGSGGIGLILATYLARSVNARLALVGRSPMPPRHMWSDFLAREGTESRMAQKIRHLQALEELGAEYLLIEADVTNEQQMRRAVEQTTRRFGTIHGVFHTAGVPGAGLIQLKKPEVAARVLAPKVIGARILTKVLAECPSLVLDFMVLFSSVTAVTGGQGQVDYCAANAFLDAYAHVEQPHCATTVAIGWSEWQWNAWEENLAGFDAETQNFFRTHRETFGITEEEGTCALMRILNNALRQVIVATQPLQEIIKLGNTLTTTALMERTREQSGRTKYPRPSLASTYVPAGNELERQIGAIWEDLLGITPVGVNDNFFELGGNSLIGLDLIARMRKALHVEALAAYLIYEAPTVKTLADTIEASRTPQPGEARSDRGTKRREALRHRMHETGRTR